MRSLGLLPIVALLALGAAAVGRLRSPRPIPVDDGFYIWQRLWNEGVVAAVQAESGPLFPLVCSLSGREAIAEWCVPDWEAIRSADHATPVVRVAVDALESRDLAAKLVGVVATLSQRLGSFPATLQLDVDCPESRLAEYARFLQGVRERLPTVELSITALPRHLSRKEFRSVVRQVDYYVLQLHGLDVPRDLDDDVLLLDPGLARRSLVAAERLRTPYRVALPAYAYELNFMAATGAFHHLNAEAWRGRDSEMIVRLLTADPGAVAGLVCELRKPRFAPHCQGIVWFRLPVPGDRLVWDRRTLARLQEGKLPRTGFATRWAREEHGGWELWLENDGVLGHREVDIRLDWDESTGDSDSLAGFFAPGAVPGRLPRRLRGMPPPPGMACKVAWFRPDNQRSARTVSVEMEVQP